MVRLNYKSSIWDVGTLKYSTLDSSGRLPGLTLSILLFVVWDLDLYFNYLKSYVIIVVFIIILFLN